jgi:hypothetical protein
LNFCLLLQCIYIHIIVPLPSHSMNNTSTTTIHIGSMELLVTVDHSNNTITMNSQDIMTCLDNLGKEMQQLREQKDKVALLASNALSKLPRNEVASILLQFRDSL